MSTPITLKVFSGDALLATKEFNQDVIKVGKLASAHLRLEDTKVSSIHAVLETGAGKEVYIVDMGSAAGTYVNGEKVNKSRLKDGDVITLGGTKLQVGLASSGAEAGAAKPAPVLGAAGRSTSLPKLPVAAAPAVAAATPARTASLSQTPAATAGRTPSLSGVAAAPGRSVSVPDLAQAKASPQPGAKSPGLPLAAAGARVSVPGVAAVRAQAPKSPPAEAAAEDTPPAELDPEAAPEPEQGPMETAPEPVPDASAAVLEVQVRWGATVIEVQHHPHPPAVTIGPGGDIHLDAAEFPAPPRPLFTCTGGQYSLHTNPAFGGFLRLGSEGVKTLAEVAGEEGAGGSKCMVLQPDHSGELTYHDMVLAFRFNEPRLRMVPTLMGQVDFHWANTLMATVLMSAAFIATLVLYPQDTKSLEEDLFQTNNRFTQFIVNPEKKPKENKLLDKLNKVKDAPVNTKATASTSNSKEVAKVVRKELTKEEVRSRNEAKAKKAIGALFGDGGSSSAVFASASASSLESAMGGISSRAVADAYGFGGLGERGHGPGGGGAATGTFGVGRVGTLGRGGGNAAYGRGSGGLGGKSERAIGITTGDAVIMGSLDKEIIRGVIKANLAQIKFCYERELTLTPDLAGKVMVQFVIGPQGSVQKVDIKETSLKSAKVEGCIKQKVRSWVFPKPKGGGIVVVSYPFIFKQGG